MTKIIFPIAIVSLSLMACSGGGSGGSRGSSPSTAGYIGAPSATCAGVSCVPGATVSSSAPSSFASGSRAVDLYEAFNNGLIAQLNEFLAKVYSGMVAGGSTSCSDVTIGGSGTVNGYDYSVTSANKSIANAFTKGGTSYDYRIEASLGESIVAEIQVYCGQETVSDPLTVTARVKESGKQYEFIYEKTGNKIRVMGAGILTTGERMVAWFKTDDGDDFDLIVKSNIDSATDYYVIHGKKSADAYNISNVTDTSQTCINSSNGAGNCTGINQPALPTLAVTNSNDFNALNVSTFTIANP